MLLLPKKHLEDINSYGVGGSENIVFKIMDCNKSTKINNMSSK